MCKNEAFLAAIRGRKEGRPDWWRIGLNLPRIPRKSRTNHWEFTGPSFWALIAARDGIFPGAILHPDIAVAIMFQKNEAYLAAIMGPERGSPGIVAGRSQFSQNLPEITDQSLGINGAFIMGPNRG